MSEANQVREYDFIVRCYHCSYPFIFLHRKMSSNIPSHYRTGQFSQTIVMQQFIHLGSMTYSAHAYSQGGGRAVHERSHSDTPTPLPSVDLSVESSSVTSLSNLPLRKNIASGEFCDLFLDRLHATTFSVDEELN